MLAFGYWLLAFGTPDAHAALKLKPRGAGTHACSAETHLGGLGFPPPTVVPQAPLTAGAVPLNLGFWELLAGPEPERAGRAKS